MAIRKKATAKKAGAKRTVRKTAKKATSRTRVARRTDDLHLLANNATLMNVIEVSTETIDTLAAITNRLQRAIHDLVDEGAPAQFGVRKQARSNANTRKKLL